MRKTWSLSLALALLLVFGLVQVAGAFSLGAEWQTGQTDMTLGTGDTPEKNFEIPLPSYRLVAEGSSGPWTWSAFYAGSDALSPTLDPNSWGALYDNPWGLYREAGGDLGYQFPLGSLVVEPKVGYRYTLMMAGGRDNPDPVTGDWEGESQGLMFHGVRLAATVRKDFGDKLTVKAEAGYSPSLDGWEVGIHEYHYTENSDYSVPGELGQWQYWQPLGITASGTDFGVSAAYRFSDRLTFKGAWSLATTTLSYLGWRSYLGIGDGDGSKAVTSRLTLGATYTF